MKRPIANVEFVRGYLDGVFAELADALRLYERAGFRTTETKTALIWGAERTEVRMDLALDP